MADKSARNIQVPVIVAIIGLFGSVIVAYFTAISTRGFALRQNVNELRQKAYMNFMEGQALLWKAQNQEEKDRAEEKITGAKYVVLLIASKDVICSMVRYWATENSYKICQDASLRQKDAAIYQAMRKESFDSLGLEHTEIDAAIVVPFLWRCLLPDSKLEQVCPGP